MFRKILRIFLLVLLFGAFSTFGLSINLAIAATPEEECQHAEEAGLDCKVCGDCAVIYNNVGDKHCKKCNDVQCTLDDCKNCSDPDCAGS